MVFSEIGLAVADAWMGFERERRRKVCRREWDSEKQAIAEGRGGWNGYWEWRWME
jgi:hypothetical protein